jgi:Rhomboid family
MAYALGDSQNSLTRLVIINLIVFIALALCKAYFFFFYQDTAQIELVFRQQILQWFALPGQIEQWLYRPWTLLSALFTNVGVWMVLGNMLWLWAFGFIFQDLSGSRKIIAVYLYGGLAGGLSYGLTASMMGDAAATGYFYRRCHHDALTLLPTVSAIDGRLSALDTDDRIFFVKHRYQATGTTPKLYPAVGRCSHGISLYATDPNGIRP